MVPRILNSIKWCSGCWHTGLYAFKTTEVQVQFRFLYFLDFISILNFGLPWYFVSQGCGGWCGVVLLQLLRFAMEVYNQCYTDNRLQGCILYCQWKPVRWMPEQRNNAQWESFKDKNFRNLFDQFEATNRLLQAVGQGDYWAEDCWDFMWECKEELCMGIGLLQIHRYVKNNKGRIW